MDKDILDMFNLLIDNMNGMEQRLEKNLTEKIDQKIAESETRIMVYIENNVGRRLDAMMDGYKTNYEQNKETVLRVNSIEDNVSDLQDRVVLLENAS